MPEIRRMGYILTAVLALTALAAFAWKPQPPGKFKGMASTAIPRMISGYRGVDQPIDAATRAAIPSADIIDRRYENGDGQSIDVTVIGGTGRNELHDPRSCLVGAGWQIQNDRVEYLPSPGNIAVRACEISVPRQSDSMIGDQAAAEDMLYVYVINKKTVASASAIRWDLLTSDLLEQNDNPVYFVRTVAALPTANHNSQDNLAEHRQLEQFTAELWKAISPVIDRGGQS
jgi:hypothetical protein